jgi:hypothetical protein
MKVIITISDKEDDQVEVSVEFDPPIDRNNTPPSGALHMANIALEAMNADED